MSRQCTPGIEIEGGAEQTKREPVTQGRGLSSYDVFPDGTDRSAQSNQRPAVSASVTEAYHLKWLAALSKGRATTLCQAAARRMTEDIGMTSTF